jgi:flavin reductase (DIM6/NTAB) family NADH-FMN oxidoreductase RutF
MKIDPSEHTHSDNYKILTSVVVPRPVAWITSLSSAGVVNLAPFSFFNAVSGKPIYLAVSVGLRDDGQRKDTAVNIEQLGEFVVHLVTEELLGAMNISAADFPPDQSELLAADLHTTSSEKVRVPRVAEAPVALECKLTQSLPLGSNTLFIGEVVMFHVADRLLRPGFHVDGFAPIGRLGWPSMYCRTTDRFTLPRVSYAKVAKLTP